jgi:hypothetical protein
MGAEVLVTGRSLTTLRAVHDRLRWAFSGFCRPSAWARQRVRNDGLRHDRQGCPSRDPPTYPLGKGLVVSLPGQAKTSASGISARRRLCVSDTSKPGSRRREVSKADLDCRFPDRLLFQSETLNLLLQFFCARFLALLNCLLVLSEAIDQHVLDPENPGLFFRRESLR